MQSRSSLFTYTNSMKSKKSQSKVYLRERDSIVRMLEVSVPHPFISSQFRSRNVMQLIKHTAAFLLVPTPLTPLIRRVLQSAYFYLPVESPKIEIIEIRESRERKEKDEKRDNISIYTINPTHIACSINRQHVDTHACARISPHTHTYKQPHLRAKSGLASSSCKQTAGCAMPFSDTHCLSSRRVLSTSNALRRVSPSTMSRRELSSESE